MNPFSFLTSPVWNKEDEKKKKPIKVIPPAQKLNPQQSVRLIQGLDKGMSWEDISSKSGVDLERVKQFSLKTRPNYGRSPYASDFKGVTGTDWNKAAKNVGNFALGGTAKLVNQGLGIIENTGGNIASAITGNQKIQQDVKRHVDQNLLGQNKGLFGTGGIYNSTDALKNASAGDVALRAGGTGLQSLTERLAPGAAGVLFKGVKPIVNKAVHGAVTGALLGGANSAGAQLSTNAKVDPIETLKAAGAGAAVGVALPVLGAAATKTKQVVTPVIKQGAKKVLDSVDQAGIPKESPLRVPLEDRRELSDFVDMQMNRYKPDVPERNRLIKRAYEMGDKYGVDVRTGGAAQIQDRVANYLDSLNTGRAYQKQGGFAKIPGKADDQIEVMPAPVKTKPVEQQIDTQTQPQQISNIPPRGVTTATDQLPQYPNSDLARTTGQPTKKSQYASKTVPESEFVGERVGQQTKQNAPDYTPETERGRYTQTLKSADDMGFDNFENDVHARLQGEHIDSQTVADSQAVAQRLEAKGDDISLRRAADIYDKVSEHLTKAGQTVQAAAIMSRRTPEGLRYQALKDIRNAGGEIDPNLQRRINTLVEDIKKAQPETEAHAKALGQLAKEVDKNIPNSAVSNLVSVWKAGLLSGVKTTQGNILSNATFGVLGKVSTPVTSFVDDAMSLITGKRTTTMTQKGVVSGTAEGVKKGTYTLKTGIDLRNVKDKYEGHKGINFKNQTVQKIVGNPAQKVFDFMSAQDQPFYFAQLKNSLYDQAKADGINRGLNGVALKRHMDELVANPSDVIIQQATDDAAKAVLGYDTPVSKFIQSGKQAIDRMPISDVGKATSKAVVDVLAPFVRVPTAFLARAIDYTPLGIAKTTLSQIARKQFDQRALAKAIGEGATGTGLIVIGSALSQSGDLSGDYPTSPKEQQRWKAEGIQPNSVKLGSKWVSLNYLGPIGMLFGAGKKFQEASAKGGDFVASTGAAIGGFGQTLLGQSFLQGLNGFIEASKDPARYLENYVKGLAGSTVPSLVNDFANLTDGFQREAGNAFEAIMSRLPGARQQLPAKQDVYGNKLTQNAAQTLTALKPSSQQTNAVIDEVSRLSAVNRDDPDLQVTPTPVDKTITINGNKIALDDKQRYDLQSRIGQRTQSAWDSIIKTPEYAALSDADKAKALNNLRQDTTAVEARSFVADNNLGTYDKELSNAQKKLASDGSTVAGYAKSGDAKATATTYADKYQNALDDYKKNSASYSPIERTRKEKELRQLTVQKDYDNDTVALYDMSKSDVFDLVSKSDKGQEYVDNLLKYGDALVNAGLATTNKFRDKSGNIVLRSSKAKTTSTRKTSARGKKLSPSSFKLPTSLTKYRTKGAELARNAKLYAKKA